MIVASVRGVESMRGAVSTPGLVSAGVLPPPGAQDCAITKTTSPVSASALAASAEKQQLPFLQIFTQYFVLKKVCKGWRDILCVTG